MFFGFSCKKMGWNVNLRSDSNSFLLSPFLTTAIVHHDRVTITSFFLFFFLAKSLDRIVNARDRFSRPARAFVWPSIGRFPLNVFALLEETFSDAFFFVAFNES